MLNYRRSLFNATFPKPPTSEAQEQERYSGRWQAVMTLIWSISRGRQLLTCCRGPGDRTISGDARVVWCSAEIARSRKTKTQLYYRSSQTILQPWQPRKHAIYMVPLKDRILTITHRYRYPSVCVRLTTSRNVLSFAGGFGRDPGRCGRGRRANYILHEAA
jgi:hypothetical protein